LRHRQIRDKSASVGGSDNVDAVSREIPDRTFADDEFSSADHIDPVQTRPQSFNIESFKEDLVGRRGVDDNAIRPGYRTPASNCERMLIDLVMVTAPKPPGSRTLISPPAAVFEIAPAKVLQGAVRLQGLASSPTPDTQVLVAWAFAGTENRVAMIIAGIMASSRPKIFM
jgi:hypothetical protein